MVKCATSTNPRHYTRAQEQNSTEVAAKMRQPNCNPWRALGRGALAAMCRLAFGLAEGQRIDCNSGLAFHLVRPVIPGVRLAVVVGPEEVAAHQAVRSPRQRKDVLQTVPDDTASFIWSRGHRKCRNSSVYHDTVVFMQALQELESAARRTVGHHVPGPHLVDVGVFARPAQVHHRRGHLLRLELPFHGVVL